MLLSSFGWWLCLIVHTSHHISICQVVCQPSVILYLWPVAALETLEASSNEDAAVRDKIEEAIFWYEKFLGFKIVVGEEGKQ